VRRHDDQPALHFSLFAPPELHNCAGPHDHGDIVKAVLAGDAGKARALMREHLTGLVELLSVREEPPAEQSLEDVFRLVGPRAFRVRGPARS
jgi:DNA-binding GntR family transcriptional regulator